MFKVGDTVKFKDLNYLISIFGNPINGSIYGISREIFSVLYGKNHKIDKITRSGTVGLAGFQFGFIVEMFIAADKQLEFNFYGGEL